MNISIPINASPDEFDRREWQAGDFFTYEGDVHIFTGRDRVGGLHARKFADGWIRVFESSRLWERIGS